MRPTTHFENSLKKLTANASDLTQLDLSNNGIDDAQLCHLIIALTHNTQLTELNLSNNTAITPLYMPIFGTLLKKNTTLKKLDLTRIAETWNILDNSITLIVYALIENTSLISLNLSQCKINVNIGDPEYKKCFSDLLTCNKTLTQLDLSYNLINDDFINYISESFKENTTLHQVSFLSNSITAVGAEIIANILQSNTTLLALNIEHNRIRKKGANALAMALKHYNNSLLKLDYLALNQLINTKAVECTIKSALEENQVTSYFPFLILFLVKFDKSSSFNPLPKELIWHIALTIIHLYPDAHRNQIATIKPNFRLLTTLFKASPKQQISEQKKQSVTTQNTQTSTPKKGSNHEEEKSSCTLL